MKKISKHAIIYVLLFILLSACSNSDNNTPSNQANNTETVTNSIPEVRYLENGKPDPAILAAEQVLHRGNGSQPQTLDPHKGEGVPSSHVSRDLFEGLVGEKPNGDLTSAGAESWKISSDQLTYTFKIRKNNWSNGDPVTAHDFEYGLKRSADPATGSKYSQILVPIKNATEVISGAKPVDELGVKALDDYTLEIKLNGPTPYFLGLLTHSTTYPIHKDNVEKFGDQFARPNRLVSNGAYKLTESVVQSHILAERNEHYWNNENTIIDKVYFYPIEDQSTELKRYRARELDWTYELPNNQFRWIKENLPDELVISPYLGIYYYGFNTTKPPFKDNIPLRKALALAIDREIITGKVTQFGEKPAYNYVPPGVSGYQSLANEWENLSKEERLELAKKYYEEAGYSTDNPLTVEIRYNTSENHKKIAVAVSAMWKQNLGVTAELVNEEWKVFLENRKQKQITQVFRAGWISDYNDPFSFLELLHTTHGINDSAYNNPVYDDLLAKISAEKSSQKRLELMQKAEQIMLADQPIAPIYSYVTKRLVAPYLKGWEDNVMDHNYTKSMFILKH